MGYKTLPRFEEYENKKIVGLLVAVFLVAPAWVFAPKIPPFQEEGNNTQLLIENNSFKGKTALIWGIERELWEVADKYSLEPNYLMKLAICESSLIHENRWGDNGLSYGLFQWQKKSWDLYNKKFGLNLDRYKLEDQIEMTALVINNGGQHNWKSCFNKINGL